MDYDTKNFTEQGGDITHIGGKLIIEEGASIEGLPSATVPVATTTTAGVVIVGSGLTITDGVLSVSGITPAENQSDSTAETVAALVTDFNALLTKLKAAGLMESDEESTSGSQHSPGAT